MPVLLRNPLGRLLALTTCVSLSWASLVPTTALAATISAPPAETSDNADAEVMFRRGQAKYETADYAGAIDLWTEAYALVESTPETASIKALLLYNLAQAHVKAYELDEDAIHLKQAQQLLSSFRNNLTLLYEDEAQLEEETKKVDERLAEIEAMIAANKPPPKDEPPPPEIEPPPSEVEPVAEVVEQPGRPGQPLMIAGGVMLGLGVAGAVVGVVGAALGSGANDISDLDATDIDAREQRFATGRSGNVLLVVGSITAGVMLPVGGTLVGLGAKRNTEAKRGTAILQRTRLGASFGGAWGNGGGLTFSGRF